MNKKKQTAHETRSANLLKRRAPLAYIKPLQVKDLPAEIAAAIPLPKQTQLYALCAEDGTTMTLAESPEAILALARAHHLEPLTLH